MKRIIIIVVLILAWGSIIGQTASKKTEAYISDRVTHIYNEIIHDLNLLFTLDEEELEDSVFLGRYVLEELYCSAKWNQLRSSVEKKEVEEEDLFFDSDYWINAQDFGELRVDKVIVEALDNNLSIVSVVLDDSGYKKRIYLVLCYERGDWFVDDFIISLRGEMQEYLKEDDEP